MGHRGDHCVFRHCLGLRTLGKDVVFFYALFDSNLTYTHDFQSQAISAASLILYIGLITLTNPTILWWAEPVKWFFFSSESINLVFNTRKPDYVISVFGIKLEKSVDGSGKEDTTV